jgi:hypothetical protein
MRQTQQRFWLTGALTAIAALSLLFAAAPMCGIDIGGQRIITRGR